MNNIKIEELMKVRFDGIANRIGQLSKRESESLLLEHLEWFVVGLGQKKTYQKKPKENGRSKSTSLKNQQ